MRLPPAYPLVMRLPPAYPLATRLPPAHPLATRLPPAHPLAAVETQLVLLFANRPSVHRHDQILQHARADATR